MKHGSYRQGVPRARGVISHTRSPWGVLLCTLVLAGCGGGGGSGGSSSVGAFEALGSNVEEGVVWELNRPIRIEFNHPVDPSSVSFGSVVLRPLDAAIQGRPVTGLFELEPGSGDRVLVFRPTCPTNEADDNGGFVPGGYRYELTLPTQRAFGASVLRDRDGRPLQLGLSRRFFTPRPPGQALYLDPVATPPRFAAVEWPDGLNLFTAPDPLLRVSFDQAIDGGADNLNEERLYVLYAAGERGSGGQDVFPDQNRLPGSWVLAANCTAGGAEAVFQISGLLPPNRKLRLVMENDFRDIAGQTNVARLLWSPDHATPSLTELYQDPGWSESDPAVDELRESFDTTLRLAGEEELVLPPAVVADGVASAGFDFPGRFVPADADLELSGSETRDVFTDGVTNFTDSKGKNFTVENGVLYVDDMKILSGSTLRGKGRNPLVIYATGDITVDGTLDVSGNHAHWPTSLDSPQFPEGGSLGECGGGQGGDASQVTNAETLRGEAGDGPFGLALAGGGGGEGGFTQAEHLGERPLGVGVTLDQRYKDARIISGGGAGGTYAMVPNDAILWTRWSGTEDPGNFDDAGPDHSATRHPSFDPRAVRGGESGMRGSSFESAGPILADWPEGVYGMEDRTVDRRAYDGATDDPFGGDSFQWQSLWMDPPSVPIYDAGDPLAWWGDPPAGPDPGNTNQTNFRIDPLDQEGSSRDDFYGRRRNADGSDTVGELLSPHAGYGGGASGDLEVLKRTDGAGNVRPLVSLFPDVPFRTNSVSPPGWYYKGAPGGGGGGQLLLFAIGTIKLGANAVIKANGGIGHGGESDIYTYSQISGSGGGSGGHVVIHSATKIDLTAIDVGTANTAAQVANLNARDSVQTIGGRRGWAMAGICAPGNSPTCLCSCDGNGDYQIGRGGAGGSGVISWHVPDPLTDIEWHRNAAPGIAEFIADDQGALDPDQLEIVLDLYTAPRAYSLIPSFSSTSQAQSLWIDTGLAYLRRDPEQQSLSPDWADPLLRFQGVDALGYVLRAGGKVTPLANVASGAMSGAVLGAFELNLSGASQAFAPSFLRTPQSLIGYEVLPRAEAASPVGFEIVAAVYDRAADTLRLSTRNEDGPMTLAAGSTWAVRAKFFRVATAGVKDSLPNSTQVQIEFQGADDPADPDGVVPGGNGWTADLAPLRGKRFLRWRITFDMDYAEAGVSLNSPRPSVDYLKIPFVW